MGHDKKCHDKKKKSCCKKYDFVMAGCGSTGLIIARKLVDAGKSVFILERGANKIKKEGNFAANVFSPNTFAFAYNNASGLVNPNLELSQQQPWSTISDVRLTSTRVGTYTEGNGWGGGSAHHFMNAFRGSPEVWNTYDALSGNTGSWSYNTLLPFMKAFETYTVRPGNTPPDAQRGTSGPLSIIQQCDYSAVTSDPIVAAFAAAPGVGVGFTEDLNSGLQSQVGWTPKQMIQTLPFTPTGATARTSTFEEFLTIGEVIDEQGNGLNGYDITLKSNSLVSRVLFKGNKAIGLEYYCNDIEYTANATIAYDPLFPGGYVLPLAGATIKVNSTEVFPVSGNIKVDEFYNITYTGTTVNSSGFVTSFTGCSTLPNQTGVINAGAVGKWTSVSNGVGRVDICECAGPKHVYGRQVILCAGVFNNPSILQRSGVGDSAFLASLGIPTVIHSPNVGQNMTVHEQLLVRFGGGVQLTNAAGWVACGQDLHGLPAPYNYSAGTRRYTATASSTPLNGNSITITGVLYQPLSRGFCNITSKDPDAKLDINYNLFTDAGSALNPPTNGSDVNRLMAWAKIVQQLATAAGVGLLLPPASAYVDDLALANYVRANANTQNHNAGTCKFGTSILDGVVDVDLKVFGATNLMVADLSVYPYTPNGNPQLSTWMVAVRALQSLGIPVLPLL